MATPGFESFKELIRDDFGDSSVRENTKSITVTLSHENQYFSDSEDFEAAANVFLRKKSIDDLFSVVADSKFRVRFVCNPDVGDLKSALADLEVFLANSVDAEPTDTGESSLGTSLGYDPNYDWNSFFYEDGCEDWIESPPFVNSFPPNKSKSVIGHEPPLEDIVWDQPNHIYKDLLDNIRKTINLGLPLDSSVNAEVKHPVTLESLKVEKQNADVENFIDTHVRNAKAALDTCVTTEDENLCLRKILGFSYLVGLYDNGREDERKRLQRLFETYYAGTGG